MDRWHESISAFSFFQFLPSAFYILYFIFYYYYYYINVCINLSWEFYLKGGYELWVPRRDIFMLSPNIMTKILDLCNPKENATSINSFFKGDDVKLSFVTQFSVHHMSPIFVYVYNMQSSMMILTKMWFRLSSQFLISMPFFTCFLVQSSCLQWYHM